jgi:hypothetical protein
MKRHNQPPVYPLAPVLLALIAVSVLCVSYWGSEVSALGVFAIPAVVVFGIAGLVLGIRRLFRRSNE